MNHTIHLRNLCMILAVIAGSVSAWANSGGSNKTYYSQVNVCATGEGTVYVSTENKDIASSHGKTSSAENSGEASSAPKHTYYLFASGGSGTPEWKNGDELVGRGNCSFQIQAAEDVADATANLTMQYVTYYSKCVANSSYSNANVYVSNVNSSAGATYGQTSEASQNGVQSQTYYLFAEGVDGKTFAWADGNGQKIGTNNPQTYTVTVSATDVANPDIFRVTLGVEKGPKEFTYQGLDYKVNDDWETVTLKKQSTSLTGDIVIPAVVNDGAGNDYVPTGMEGGAFQNCEGITSVVCHAPIRTLGNISVNLNSIIGKGGTVKGSGIFYNCTSLKKVDIQACEFTDTKGGGTCGGIFAGCSVLSDVTMPNTLEILGSGDFAGCSALRTLDLGNTSLTKVDDYACCGKNADNKLGVQNVYLPETVTEIGGTAFAYNDIRKITDLWSPKFKNITKPTDDQLEKYPYLSEVAKTANALKNFSHLGNVNSFGTFVFTGNLSFGPIVLTGKNLKTIPQNAFVNCFNCNWVLWGDAIETLGEQAFNGDGMSAMNYVGSGVKINQNGNGLTYPGAVVIPPTMKTINNQCNTNGASGFIRNNTKVYLPANINSLASNSMQNATNIDVYFYRTSKPGTLSTSAFASGQTGTIHYPVGTSSNIVTQFSNYAMDIELNKVVSAIAEQMTAICLPEVAEQPAGADFYTVSRKLMDGEDAVALILAPVAKGERLEAGVPYIFVANASGDLTFDYVYGAKPATEGINANGLQGTFASTDDVFAFVDGVLTENAVCNAYSAYIDLEAVAAGEEEAADGELKIVLKEEEDLPEFVYTYTDPETGETMELELEEDEEFYPYFTDFQEDPVTNERTVSVSAANFANNAPRKVAALDGKLPAGMLQGKIVIPSEVLNNGKYYTVNKILPYAFANQHFITSVTIPNTITEVGMEEQVIPEIASMWPEPIEGSGIFYDCFGLKEVVFQNGSTITNLGAGAFFGCINLENVVLPEALETIADGMFSACYSLGELTLPENVEELGFFSFMRTGIPAGTDEGNLFGTYIVSDILDDVERKALYEEAYSQLFAEYYNVPEYEFHFTDLIGKGLTKINLPAATTGIKYGSFRESYHLASISQGGVDNVLANVKNLGQFTFSRTALREIALTNTNIVSIPHSTFSQCSQLEKVVLPAGLKEVGQSAFKLCYNLRTVTYGDEEATAGEYKFPETLEHIGALAFAYDAAATINLPASLKRISSQAFNPESSLKQAIAKSATPPVLGAVSTNPLSPDFIDNDAASQEYLSCTYNEVDLSAVAGTPDAFKVQATRPGLLVPEGAAAAYRAAGYETAFQIIEEVNLKFTDWDTATKTCALASLQNTAMVGKVEVPEKTWHDGAWYTVNAVQPFAFKDCYYITEVTLPSSIKTVHLTELNVPEIGDYPVDGASGLFYNCVGLRKAIINSEVEDLGAGCFFGCINLSEVALPETLTMIADGMFNGCYSLTSITIPEYVESLGYYAFARTGIPGGTDNGTLMSYYIPIPEFDDVDNGPAYEANYTTLIRALYGDETPAFTFAGLIGKGLESVQLPEGELVIKYGAFREAYNLNHVSQDQSHENYLGNVVEVGAYAFSRCYRLTNVTLTNSEIEKLPHSVFSQCLSLKSVQLGSNVKVIGTKAFNQCLALTQMNDQSMIAIPEGVTDIHPFAFHNCMAIAEIHFPSTLEKIHGRAFHHTTPANMKLGRVEVLAETAPVLANSATDEHHGLLTMEPGQEETSRLAVAPQSVIRRAEGEPATEIVAAEHDAFPSMDEGSKITLVIPNDTTDDYLAKGWGRTFDIVELDQTGVKSPIAANAQIALDGNTVLASGMIRAYTIDGRLAAEGMNSVKLESGIYVVRTANGASKVAIK